MKNEISIKMSVVKELGAIAAVALGVINSSVEPLSNTEVSNIMGISFPTAQKSCKALLDCGYIKGDGKGYSKI